MSTDDTRPLPAADDETPTRAIEPVVTEPMDEAVEAPVDEPVDETVDERADEHRVHPADGPVTTPTATYPAVAPGPAVYDRGGDDRPAAQPDRAAAAALPAPQPQTPAGPDLRVGTVVWGLVVAVVGIGIVSFAWGARIDGGLALIVLLAGAGVALLVGSLVVGARRPRRRAGRG